MNELLKNYVNHIVAGIDGTPEDKADMEEEMLVHLELLAKENMVKGLSEQEAAKMAIQQFGNHEKIGREMQQVLYPYRKQLFIFLAMLSLFSASGLYLAHLLINGDAEYDWLITSISIGTILLVLAFSHFRSTLRKRWSIILLIVHLLLWSYGLLGAANLSGGTIESLMLILTWLNLILTAVLLYQTALLPGAKETKVPSGKKVIHILYITTGLIICAACLFFIYGGLVMIGKLHFMMLIFLTPLAVWGALYRLQLVQWEQREEIVLWTPLLPVLLSLIIVGYLLLPLFI
ncbi:permease prefix domain 1-containing protein [Neobacillus dielmonensis]|uniref:permease prefix domain 1-containing protein n=1 Tax=Neobacillus dielmonensis TaxID=1347369 RepID=UPI0005A5E07A|nr:permease prefix domain 1-containing protein [Neobacillus dielmonensis]